MKKTLVLITALSMLFMIESVVSADLSDGLVAYYTFTGNAIDLSGNANNGVILGASLAADMCGDTSGAYSFDGVGDSIKVSHSPSLDITDEITMTAWVNWRGPGQKGRLSI